MNQKPLPSLRKQNSFHRGVVTALRMWYAKAMFDAQTKSLLGQSGVFAVLTVGKAEDAPEACKALLEGGVKAIELALRTPTSMQAVELVARDVPEMLLGIGTVIKKGQAKAVKELGADFGVSPGCNPAIIEEAQAVGLPFAPGIATASELEQAYELGCDTMKLFPAEPLGGVSYLKAMSGPYSYLGISFVPLGGVNLSNLGQWASQKNVLAVGGSWIAGAPLVETHDWRTITKNAKEAMEIWNNFRK